MSAGELLLTYKLVRAEFVLVTNQTARMGNNGNSIVTEQGPSLYKHIVETEELDLASARAWKAWCERREGRMYTYTGWDLFYVNPLLPLDTADGSLTLTVDSANSQITVGGVGTWAARVGDMVSYRTAANGFYCGRVQADASPSAGDITLTMWPRPVAKHATTPAVRRVQALAEFEITTDLSGFEPYSGRKLSFEAQQVTRD
jgi:hypothetical protein